jgi:hypothetical protein
VESPARISQVLGKKLEEMDFDKAYVVLGRFLVLKKDEDLFQEMAEGYVWHQYQAVLGLLWVPLRVM